MKYNYYTLKEISNWLLNPNKIFLPAIQRGFVWNPSQIENLWDSLFRGFPIGSLLLSECGEEYSLLDGQQRATTIAFGFFDPWKSSLKAIGNSKDTPVIWLDLDPRGNITYKNKYLFRTVTKSHPWGYQIKNNNLKLTIDDRRKASVQYKELYGIEQYTKLSANQRFPFDCRLPIPIAFLLNNYEQGISHNDWWAKVLKQCESINQIRTKYISSDEEYISLLKKNSDTVTQEYFEVVKSLMEETQIAATIIKSELFDIADEEGAEDPTLFIRLNSAGTQLNGEELIYSTFKSIFPDCKRLVEEIGVNYISPSRLITLFSRIIKSSITGNYVKKITVKQFQVDIHNEEFKNKLLGTISSGKLKEIFNKSINILKVQFSNEDKFNCVPDVFVRNFISKSPEGFLLLLNWLYRNDNSDDNRDDNLDFLENNKFLIAERLYSTFMLGDLDSLVKELWIQSSEKKFWNLYSNIVAKHQLPYIRPQFVEKIFKAKIETDQPIETITKEDNDVWNEIAAHLPKYTQETEENYFNRIQNIWKDFIYKIVNNRQFLYIAQREYINETFQDYNQLEIFQDTSVPWDIDHIYPKHWIYRLWNIDTLNKYWEDKIGNLRIMSLTDNRSESDNYPPAERFPDEKTKSQYFIKDNDLKYWLTLNNREKKISAIDSKNHAIAIATRTANLYAEYYSLFKEKLKEINRQDNLKILKPQFILWSQDTKFADSDWVVEMQLCSDYQDCVRVFNEYFHEDKFVAEIVYGHKIIIRQLKSATPEDQWGIANIFRSLARYYYKYVVYKKDFEKELLAENCPMGGQRPDYPIYFNSDPEEKDFILDWSTDRLMIARYSMIFDGSTESLWNDEIVDDTKYLCGEFDKEGNVINKISITY